MLPFALFLTLLSISIVAFASSDIHACGSLRHNVIYGFGDFCYMFLRKEDVRKVREKILKDATGADPILDKIVYNASHALQICLAAKHLESLKDPHRDRYHEEFAKIMAKGDVNVTLPMPQQETDVEFILNTVMVTDNDSQVFLAIDSVTHAHIRKPFPIHHAIYMNTRGGSGDCAYLLKHHGEREQGLYYIQCNHPYIRGLEGRGSQNVVCQFDMPTKCVQDTTTMCEEVADDCKLATKTVTKQKGHRLAVTCPQDSVTHSACPRSRVVECSRDCMWGEWQPIRQCQPCQKVHFTRTPVQTGFYMGKPCDYARDPKKVDLCPPCPSSTSQIKSSTIFIAISLILASTVSDSCRTM